MKTTNIKAMTDKRNTKIVFFIIFIIHNHFESRFMRFFLNMLQLKQFIILSIYLFYYIYENE